MKLVALIVRRAVLIFILGCTQYHSRCIWLELYAFYVRPESLLHPQSYDAAYSLPAIAPRPFLIANGELDPRCPIAGLEKPVLAAKQAYEEMECPQNLKVYYEKGLAHAPSRRVDNAVDEWLDMHLLDP